MYLSLQYSVPARHGPPAHVAIIMDGNGRWAQARGLPRFEGHRRGVEAVRRRGSLGDRTRRAVPDDLQLLVRELEPARRRKSRC